MNRGLSTIELRTQSFEGSVSVQHYRDPLMRENSPTESIGSLKVTIEEGKIVGVTQGQQ